jgi:hypothetical protein
MGGERPYSLDIKLAENPGHENPFVCNLVPSPYVQYGRGTM